MTVDAGSDPPIDFLTVGHICRDLVPGGWVAGGAAAYGGSVARVLGCRVGVVTSAAREDDWQAAYPDLHVHQVPAPATTVFENVYTPEGRAQTIHSVAARLAAQDVPALWARAPMVHLGPIAGEVDPAIIQLFSNSMIGVGPQGWMRRWDSAGRVRPAVWESAAEILPLAAAVVLSAEDLVDARLLDEYRRLGRLLVVTAGADGCTVYCRGRAHAFAAPGVKEVDATGAGDIFAGAFLVRLFQTDGNFYEAAEFANWVAATSVTRRGIIAKTAAIRELVGATIPQSWTGSQEYVE